MTRKQIYLEELEDGRYTLIIVPVSRYFEVEGVKGYEAYLSKKGFGNISFLIGAEKTIDFPNINKFADFVKYGLKLGEFFYDLNECDADFKDVYDVVCVD